MSQAWRQALRDVLGPRTVIVGVGNLLRGDDAFGPTVVRRLQGRVPWPVFDAAETPENSLGRVLACAPVTVVVIDALAWGGRPGEIALLPADHLAPGGLSTHCVSLRLFAGILSDGADCRVVLVGAQPVHTEFGAPMSPPVARRVETLAAYFLELAADRVADGAAGDAHAGTR